VTESVIVAEWLEVWRGIPWYAKNTAASWFSVKYLLAGALKKFLYVRSARKRKVIKFKRFKIKKEKEKRWDKLWKMAIM
jgi:hypothetical protein